MDQNIDLTPDPSAEYDGLGGRVLTFYLGDTLYSLPLTSVTEITGVQAITKVPGTPPYVKGVVNLRGGIVPLVDMRLKFGRPERAYDAQTNVIIVQLKGMQVGLVVDRVANVLQAHPADTSALPDFTTVNAHRYMTGILRAGDALVINLDCEAILEEDNSPQAGRAQIG